MALKSEILDFYFNTNILITGGSGFLGKMLIQKLLATHDDIQTIYVIIRSKGTQSSKERFNEVLNNPVFQLLRHQKPTFPDKICVLHGDVTESGFGLNNIDRKTLIEKIDIVFHCAANIHFNATLKNSIDTNVKPTYNLLDLCHEMKRLKSLVVTSTAYSNCNISTVEEKIYKSVVNPDILMELVDDMDEAALDRIAPGLVHGFPNTYTFAKNMSEQVLLAKGRNLPIVLFRPSTVISSYVDPIPGWVDNLHGVVCMLLAFKLGIGRVFFISTNCLGDAIPVDYCVNALICSAWDAEKSRLKSINDIPVYCYSAGSKYSLHWDYVFRSIQNDINNNLNQVMWKPFYILTSSAYKYFIYHFFLHLVPAYVIDTFLFITGDKPRMRKGYAKLSKLMTALSFFTTREWDFKNYNIYSMWDRMSAEEKILYPFHMGSVDYNKYFENFSAGLKKYVLKESMDNVDEANSRYRRLVVAHYVLVFGLCMVIFWAGCMLVEYLL